MKIKPVIFLLTFIYTGVFTYAQGGNCEVTTFQKTYGKPGISDLVYGSNIVETNDHGYITGGWGGDLADHAVYMKIDNKGDVIWSKQFNAPGTPLGSIYQFIRLKDGNYLGMGGAYDSPLLWFIKFDENGNSIWQKQMTYPGVLSASAYNIKETMDGGFILAGFYNIPNFGGAFIAKLDANGNLLWNKVSNEISGTTDMTENNGSLYLIGYYQGEGIISKFNSSNGNFVQSYHTQVEGRSTTLSNIEVKNNKLYVGGNNRIAISDEERHFVMILDESLTVLKVHKFHFDFDDVMGINPVVPLDDGGYIMADNSEAYGDITLVRMSYDGEIKWKRQYPRPKAQVIFRIIKTGDNGILGLGNDNNLEETWFNIPANDILIFKTDSAGLMGDCNVIDPALTISFPAVNRTPVNYTYSVAGLTVQPFNDVANNIVIPITTLCEKVITPTCTNISVTGADTVCPLSDVIEYKATRNSGCTVPVSWKTDPSFTSIVSSTDSTVQVKFLKPGVTKLVGSITDLCQTITDSLVVHLFDAPQSLHIGPDILLCENSSHIFRAAPGFNSYRWQDGSTDSVFTAQAPGIYYVTATNCDGNLFSDTVLVTAAALPAGYLKSDTAICEGQPTTISPLSDYKSYLWSSGEQTKQINILSPTLYWLQVTDVNGCTGKDSINVTAKTGCVTALYFPSAFTPNNDGKNDLFRGIPFGYLNKYHLKIFNRYGNIIFETTDVTKGWDGNFQAKPQDTGSFIWLCQYQINSQTTQSEKGVVTLIR